MHSVHAVPIFKFEVCVCAVVHPQYYLRALLLDPHPRPGTDAVSYFLSTTIRMKSGTAYFGSLDLRCVAKESKLNGTSVRIESATQLARPSWFGTRAPYTFSSLTPGNAP